MTEEPEFLTLDEILEIHILFEPEQRVKEVSCVVREEVHAREPAAEPAGEQIDGEREAVHLDEQRNMNAERLPNVRQSRFVCGLKKLNAKKMKKAELMRTSVQSP